ncbi:MAG: site-2 protease family protein [Dehalococcoidales bacterium]|nr:site-2 protease family protein [Dehalococcoidales bacterium]NLT27749.1 site-2 protease family protein [Dehalococcoidales bacterium]
MARGSISIGKLSGISINIDYSWFFIFLLVTWSLAGSYFPSVFPEWGLVQSISAGIITSLLFFASVLAHELGHSITAQRHGIPVKSITLFIFGGLANISREPESSGVEFKIAIAGPLTSFLLGIVFWALYFLLPSPRFDGVAEIAFWLGLTNVILAVFNLLPGFPLDGGRVLRAIIWKVGKNPQKATKWVSNTGKIIAYLMIAAGIALFFTGYTLNGLWLAFIGWFLSSAASGSSRQVSLQQKLQGYSVGELMNTNYVKIPAYISIEEMYNQYIKNNKKSYLVVTSGNETLGLVNMNLLRNLDKKHWSFKTASEVMTPIAQLRYLPPEAGLIAALQLFQQEKTDQLPVARDAEIIGLISYDDLMDFLNRKA